MWLTWSRMAAAPFFIALLWTPTPPGVAAFSMSWPAWAAAALFIAASITDWLDGHFARKFDAMSNLGKFMDPIADKILVASVLIMLIPHGTVHPLPVLLLLMRDILIGGVRSVAAADQLVIDAKSAGKWKTGLQMVAIPVILLGPSFNDVIVKPVGLPVSIPLSELGTILLWLSVGLSLFSGWQYVQLYRHSRRARAKS